MHAQDKKRIFQKFKGDVSFGYSRYFGQTKIPNGFLFSAEPKYSIADKFAIGLRIEMISLAKASDDLFDLTGIDPDVTLKFHNSFLLTSDYYFINKMNRPFIGAGAGLHVISSNPFHENKRIESKFGEMIRAGMEFKRFHFAVEYNFVPKTILSGLFETYPYPGAITYYERTYSNSYLSLKLGFCIGGARKK